MTPDTPTDTDVRRLPGHYYRSPVKIVVAGCGGTGSHMISGLARLDACLRGLDHPGFEVVACDPDRVSPTNVGRQMFAPSDVGLYKADVLIHRANLWFGLDWESRPVALNGEIDTRSQIHLLIGCVDSWAARQDLLRAAQKLHADYWLDCGNGDSWGQVVLGEIATGRHGHRDLLPTVLDRFPDVDPDIDADAGPSCSLAESLGRQGPMINQALATLALDALWQTFRTGRIDRAAWFLNLASGRMTSSPATMRTPDLETAT